MNMPGAGRCLRRVGAGFRGMSLGFVFAVWFVGAGTMFSCRGTAVAATAGLPFTEDFTADNLKDPATTANWSVAERNVYLGWRNARQNVFGPDTIGTTISTDTATPQSVAVGDMDGDGDLDVVIGYWQQKTRMFLNNGTTNPFAGVIGSDISAAASNARSVALGDLDGDGDLDVVIGNFYTTSRLHLNNGTADPFAGVIGKDLTDEIRPTVAIALGDMDGDGDLDVVAGNHNSKNRLYLNNGTADPFSGVAGVEITTDWWDTEAIALGDIDGDGDLDVVTGNYGQANRLIQNNGTANPFSGVTGTIITADADATVAIALGDMDGDGDLDVVTGNDGQANRLYQNNGTGNPFAGVTGANITADVQLTYAVSVTDVDGDGDLDLIAGERFQQVNHLYLNNGTADPFAGATGMNIGVETDDTRAIAVGDMDGDGDPDLVVVNKGQPDRLYLNAGVADPFVGVTGADITADARFTRAVAVGDVDGDGDLDVVTGNYNQTNRLYQNNGTVDAFNGVAGVDITADLRNTRAIALGDVDGDGDLDAVTGNDGQANRLYQNNGTADPFSGVTGVDITSDARNARAISLGDVDGDGDLDVVVGNQNQVNRLYLNNGTATPFSGVSGAAITADVRQTQTIALGDVDGDGDLDIVTGNANQANRLYLNNGTAIPFDAVSGTDITADADSTGAIALGDVDRDGDQDVVAGNYGAASRLYLNNGTATPFDGVSGTNVSADAFQLYGIALGDIDRDGDLDVVTANNGHTSRLCLNNGTATPFDSVGGTDITTDANNARALALGDVDGDGYLDLVAGNYNQPNRLYLNGGAPIPFNGVSGSDISDFTWSTRAIALGDVDGDGDVDVVEGFNYSSYSVNFNNGTASPFPGTNRTYPAAMISNLRAIALGDVDGDGDLDLLIGTDNAGSWHFLNNGTPDPFNGVTGTEIGTNEDRASSIALGDVDRDGDLDLVLGNSSCLPSSLFLNNDTSTPFSGVTSKDIGTFADCNQTRAVALGDVDGDGDLDLVTGNGNQYNQANLLFLNNGTADPFTGVSGTNITTDSHDTRAIAIGDVDGDGDLDLVAGNSDQPSRLYLNNGTVNPFNGVVGTNITADANSTYAIALGDLDGDGDLDLVAGNSDQPSRLYLNNGTTAPFNGVAGANITADTDTTLAIALGDVDGDGALDLVAGGGYDLTRVYRRIGYQTSRGTVRSLTVDTEAGEITNAVLTPTVTLPANTWIDWYLTNNGGARWHRVRPGKAFAFPTTGSDLRWKAELHSLSPHRTPVVTQVVIDKNHAPTTATWGVATPEDTDQVFTSLEIRFTDADAGDTLQSVRVSTPPAAGTLYVDANGNGAVDTGEATGAGGMVTAAALTAGHFKFKSAANGNGSPYATFTFAVSDGASYSADGMMTIDVTAVNDAPTSANATVATAEDTNRVFAAANFPFTDVDAGASLQKVRATTLPLVGVLYVDANGNGVADAGETVLAGSDLVVAILTAGQLKFKPAANDNNSPYANFAFEVSDGVMYSTAASTMTVNVTAVNDPPTSANATVATAEDTDRVFAVANFPFTDVDAGDALQKVQVATLPAMGTLYVDANGNGVADAGEAAVAGSDVAVAVLTAGQLKFKPAANANGSPYGSFTFKVGDGVVYSAAASTMTINVTAVNDAPTSANATVATAEDTDRVFAAANFPFTDVDAGASLQKVQVATLPAAGMLYVDANGNGVADAGEAVVAGSDIAVATLTAGQVKFKPAANANGSPYASFTFKVGDGAEFSATASTMTVNVTAVNDAPTSANATVATAEDTDRVFAVANFPFTDVDAGDALQKVQVATLPAMGTLYVDANGNGVADAGEAAVAGSDVAVAVLTAGQVKFKPAANANGSPYASFSFKVGDGAEYSAAASTMTVNVTAVNDPPTSANATVATAEDTDRVFAVANFPFTDVDTGAALQKVRVTTLPLVGVLYVDANGNGVADAGEAVVAGSDVAVAVLTAGQLKFKPAANANGSAYASFKFKVSDGSAYSAAALKMTVNVTAVNDAPTSANASVGTMEDTDRVFAAADFPFTDVDAGNTLQKVQPATLPAAGTLYADANGNGVVDAGEAVLAGSEVGAATLTAGRLKFKPAAGASGGPYTSFTFKVSDGSAYSAATSTMTVNVTAVNDSPALDPIGNVTIDENSGVQTVGLAGISAGPGESQSLTVTASSSNTALIPDPVVTYTSPDATGSLAFTPEADTFGTATITVTVDDHQSSNNTAVRTFLVTVKEVISLPAPWVGSVAVASDRKVVAVSRPHIGDEVASYDGFPEGALSAYIPMLFKNAFDGSYDAALYLQNVTDALAAVTMEYYDSAGQLSCTVDDTLPARASRGYWLPQQACLPVGWVGGVVVTSDQNIVSIGRPHIGAEIMTYDGVAAGSLKAYLPMLFKDAFDGSYDAAFYVQNVATALATVTMKYYDSAGQLSCTINDTIAARASRGYWLPAQSCLPAGWVGGVVITSNRAIVAIGRPHVGAQVMSYNGFSAGGAASYVPMLFKGAFGGSYDAAFYVQNVHATNQAAIAVNYYDTAGNLSCTANDTVAALATRGYWVPLQTCLPDGWVGSVTVASDQPVVAVGRPHIGAQVTTYDGFTSGSTSSYLPMLFSGAFGGSYNSALYIQNTEAGEATVTTGFYDSAGALTCTRTDIIPARASLALWLPSLTCSR